MRICYAVADGGVPVFGNKGASVHVRELVRALGQEHTVDLFCVSLGNRQYDLPVRNLHASTRAAYIDGDPTSARDRARIATVAAVKEAVHQAARTERYDLVYERYALFSDVGASVADAYDVPFLLEVNAPLIAERQRVESLPLAGQAHETERAVFRRADAVLAVSEAMAEYVRGVGADSNRVHVVPNGVDAGLFSSAISVREARERIGLNGELVIGFVGSLKPWHGVDLLLEAFAQAARHGWRLLVIGDGPERARLEAQARFLGCQEQVIFTGPISHHDVPPYVAAMDIAVAPYRTVPDFYFSPLKLFEYLAAGKPVIASRIGQIAVVIRHGENGYLVRPDDVQSLAAALEGLAVDEGLRKHLAGGASDGLVTWHQTAERVTVIADAVRKARTIT